MKQLKALVTISNKNSPYFGEKGKILSYLPEEKAEVFLTQSEIIVVLSLNDFSEPKTKAFSPKSRKDFYEFILNDKTSRVDITKTAQAMIERGEIVIKGEYSVQALVTLLNDSERDKAQIVEDFRTLRDQGYIEFNLANNSFNPAMGQGPRNSKRRL